jgi:AraC-like DNA-binding protein
LQELADEIGLNLKKLKMGFKTFMGYRLWIFYLITKWILLENYSTAVPVNEVGLKIGYSTGSHFIAAFKRNLLQRQKKYLMSINPNMA